MLNLADVWHSNLQTKGLRENCRAILGAISRRMPGEHLEEFRRRQDLAKLWLKKGSKIAA